MFSSKRGPDPDRHDNFDLYLIDAQAGATARPLLTNEVPDSAPATAAARPGAPTDVPSPLCKAARGSSSCMPCTS
ncbi:hypothetical protein ACFQT0_28855 [Hymenobacter humi]|uniref:Uncharacterized protein n=1 Tax=Hymenobacter humi TaxID=1411620 RepID=A0ABW2UET7_9BACT